MKKEERQALSRKAWEKEEHRRLQSEGLKDKWTEPEYREKISRARKQQWADPAMREEARKARKADPPERDDKGRFRRKRGSK